MPDKVRDVILYGREDTRKNGDPFAPEGIPVRVEPARIVPLPPPAPTRGIVQFVKGAAEPTRPKTILPSKPYTLPRTEQPGFHWENPNYDPLKAEYLRYLRQNQVSEDEIQSIMQDLFNGKTDTSPSYGKR